MIKSKFRYHLWVIFFMWVIISCATPQHIVKTHKNSFYQLSILKTEGNKNPVIYGGIYDLNSKEPVALPLIMANDKKQAFGDNKGTFKFTVASGKYQFKAKGFYADFLTTKPIRISSGDSVNIVFYLKLNDDRHIN